MSSQAGPEPAEASNNGQLSRKRICLPPEIHQMIFNAIDKPNDRARTALSVMLANKELHGMWKRFLYEDNIDNGRSSALVHAVLHGFQQPMRDIVGVGITAEGRSVHMGARVEDFKNREWCFCPTTGDREFDDTCRLTVLHAAVALNDEETVRFLLQNGADPNEAGYDEEYDVDPNTVDRSERNGDDSDVWEWHSSTSQSAIHMATCQGHLPIVQLLVEAGGTLLWEPTEEDGFNVLHTAAMCGHVHLIRYFVTSGLIPIDSKAHFTQDYSYRLPMMLTAAQCAAHTKAGIKTLWLFRELKANMNRVVLSLLQLPSDTAMAHQLLTQASWEVDLRANVAKSGIRKCSLADGILELYLSMEINSHDLRGWRLVLQTALAGGANIGRSYRESIGLPKEPLLEICLNEASGKKGLVLLELILQKGALNHMPTPYNTVEEYGNSLLLTYLTTALLRRYSSNKGIWPWEPASNRDLEEVQGQSNSDDTINVAEQKVKSLLAAGIQPNGANDYGWTSLIIACKLVTRYNYPLDLMENLLESGADPNLSNQLTSPLSNGKKRSPMAVCFSNKSSYRACRLLESYGGALHEYDDLDMIEHHIEMLIPSSNDRTRVMKLFKKLASRVKEGR